MNRVKQIINSSKGFTLIEVIVTIAVAAMLVIPATDILLTSGRIYNKSQDSMEYKTIALEIEKVIKSEIKLAEKIEIKSSPVSTLNTDEKSIYLREANGKYSLIKQKGSNSQTILNEAYLKYPRIEITFFRQNSECIKLSIVINNEYSMETVFKIDNLESTGITGEELGTAIVYSK